MINGSILCTPTDFTGTYTINFFHYKLLHGSFQNKDKTFHEDISLHDDLNL